MSGGLSLAGFNISSTVKKQLGYQKTLYLIQQVPQVIEMSDRPYAQDCMNKCSDGNDSQYHNKDAEKRLLMDKGRPAQEQHAQNTDAPSCDQPLVHLDNVLQVQPEVLETGKAQRMAEFFSILADPHRLKLLSALAQQELCVCDLAAVVNMGESAVSHQLRVLRSQRLVTYRRQGRNVYYGLADDHIINLYREVAEHLDE